MKYDFLLAGMAALALGACSPDDQPLPFGTDDEVTKVIGSEGGTLSIPAGASVMIPAGALDVAVTVELAVRDLLPTIYTADALFFDVSPVGTQLNVPAEVQIRIPDSDDAWLASVVNHTPSGVEEIGNTRVDLAAGIAAADIREFGMLALVVPGADAVFQVSTATASQTLAPEAIEVVIGGTDSMTVGCGTPGDRCDGLTASASANLLARVEDAAAIFPVVNGILRFDGNTVTGEIDLSTSFRLKMESGQIAENVTFSAHVEPTAATVVTETSTEIHLTNMVYRISEAGESGEEINQFVDTLVIPKADAADGSVTVSRDFQIQGEEGQLENASVSITVPVQLF